MPAAPIKPRRLPTRAALVIFLAAAAILGTLTLRHTTSSVELKPIPARKAMTDMPLRLLDGTPWNLADHRGQVVLVNKWATWCGPCQQEVPALRELSHHYDASRFSIIGISLDAGSKAESNVRSFVARYGLTYPIALSAPEATSPFSVTPLPTTYLLDRQGRIALTCVGPVDAQALERAIAILLAEPAVPAAVGPAS